MNELYDLKPDAIASAFESINEAMKRATGVIARESGIAQEPIPEDSIAFGFLPADYHGLDPQCVEVQTLADRLLENKIMIDLCHTLLHVAQTVPACHIGTRTMAYLVAVGLHIGTTLHASKLDIAQLERMMHDVSDGKPLEPEP